MTQFVNILRCLVAATFFNLVACSHLPTNEPPLLSKTHFNNVDGVPFSVKRWNQISEPKTVIIGVHGLSGAADDFENLGTHLAATRADQSLISYDLRGQGRDPRPDHRGDIINPQFWFSDLLTFTQLVKEKHPNAKILWAGESMGSLITLHAFRSAAVKSPPCDGLILSSPIVQLRYDLPAWKLNFLRACAAIAPRLRLSFERLSNGQNLQVTSTSHHENQSAQNDWHLDHFTLRLLNTLDKLIAEVPHAATRINIPVLLLHGGKDVFSQADDVVSFAKNIPQHERKFYPESHHLLFYDKDRQQIIEDCSEWLSKNGF